MSPNALPTNDSSGIHGRDDRRDVRHVARGSLIGVDLDEEVPRDAEREEVDGSAADDLVGAKLNRDEGVHESERRTGDDAGDDPPPPFAGLVGAEKAEERTHQEHALETDVHDAAPLGEDAAQRGEGERRRRAERRGDERGPHECLLERRHVGSRRDPSEQDAEHAGRDRPPREPARRAELPRAEAGCNAADADGERHER